MRPHRHPSATALVATVATVAVLALVARAFAAGAPATLELQTEKVLLENPHVRIVEYHSRMGGGVCGAGRHSHPAHVTIVMDGGHDRMTSPEGKVETGTMKTGDVYYDDANTHEDVNIGHDGTWLILVELKDVKHR